MEEVLSVHLAVAVALLLLLAAKRTPAVAVPSPQCQRQCGGVDIVFPFGIGDNCSLSAGFNVSCQEVQVQGGVVYRPFLGNVELLNISLIHGTIRELNHISTYCYDSSSSSMELSTWCFDASETPFRFSDVQNKFTAIGCQTLAYIMDNTDKSYQSGCVSTCQSLSNLADGSCSGIGCCQTDIPKGMGFYNVSFDTGQISPSGLGRCSYAVLMEAAAFSFRTTYIDTTDFNDTSAGQVPVVMDWAIRDGPPSCELAKRNEETGSYACLSGNSECVDSPNGPGYLCNCSSGYEGNPYLPHGCHGELVTNYMSTVPKM
jgi:hypothetical protein